MVTTTREERLEEAILRTILRVDALPAVSGYSDAVIWAAQDIIDDLKSAVRK